MLTFKLPFSNEEQNLTCFSKRKVKRIIARVNEFSNYDIDILRRF